MKKFLFWTSLVFFLSVGSAFAAGNELGNGGDSIAQEFVTIGRNLLDRIREHPDPRISDLEPLERAVNSTVVVTKDHLDLNEAEVDAINYPDWNRIEVNRKRWSEYDLPKKTALVLHEYLGISRADDSHYQISSSYSDVALPPEPQSHVELQAHIGEEQLFKSDHGRQLGAEIGYKLTPRWTIGAGYDSIRYNYHDDWWVRTRNVISLFGKFNFKRWGKLEPWAKLGISYSSDSDEFANGNSQWGQPLYSKYSGQVQVGAFATLGLTYWFARAIGLDLSLTGEQENFGGHSWFSGWYSHLTGQVGVRFQF